MRAAIAAIALSLGGPAAAEPARCADLARGSLAVGGDVGLSFGGDAAGVRLGDYDYDVGYLMKGVRAAVTVRPVCCLELGAVARRWTTVEGTSSSGARLTSRGDVVAGSIGGHSPVEHGVSVGVTFELGAMHSAQTLREATVTAWSPTLASRIDLTFGRGATALVFAIDTSVYLQAGAFDGIAPSLDTVALHAGVVQRL